MKYYNIFGEYINTNTIETFAETKKETNMDKLNDAIEKINAGILSNEQAEKILLEFKELEKDNKLNNDEKNTLTSLEKAFAQKVKGLGLMGNLQLGGYVKAKGYYLEDGTKIKEFKKEILAVPYDENKNIDIKSIQDKNINITNVGKGKTNINNLNIPKSGRISFGDGQDNDPYHLRKIGNTDNNHLRLTINDNNNESIQIWGNSCNGDKCSKDGGKQSHIFYSDGRTFHKNNVGIGNLKPKSRLSVQKNSRANETKNILENNFIPTAEIKQLHSSRKNTLGGWAGPSLQFKINNGNNGGGAQWAAGTIVGSADPLNSNGGYNAGLLFYTAAGGLNNPQKLAFAIGNNDQRAYFKGNVGVGTFKPTEKLDVKGNANIDGNLKVKSLEIGNYKIYTNGSNSTHGSDLIFKNKKNGKRLMVVNANGMLSVYPYNGKTTKGVPNLLGTI